MAVTLEQLLQSREERHLHQMSLLQLYPGSTLVCMTVIMPGPVKRDSRSLTVAASGENEMEKAFEGQIRWHESRDLETGYEAYFVTDVPRDEAKRICCGIVDTAPLGRLFDLDVIGEDGAPLSRSAYGVSPRRCLLCDHEARYCMRNHTHTLEELLTKIDGMVTSFKKADYKSK